MQMLCLIKPDSRCLSRATAQGLLCLLLGLLCTTLAWSDAVKKTPLEELQEQVMRWAAVQPGLQGRTWQMVAPDWRLQIQHCQESLQLEQPFPGQPSVKVHCVNPQWQLFVNLTSSNGTSEPNKAGVNMPTATHEVLVAKELLKRGTLIGPSMFVKAQLPAPGMENQLITDAKTLVNMELVRDLAPNAPLRPFDVKPAVLVKRGQEVIVTAGEGQGFQISLRAEALQDGGLGEQIRLKNSESGRSLSAVVTGPSEAKVR